MFINLKHRSEEIEIMDDFDLVGTELERTLKILDQINRLLGGNSITLNGIGKLLAEIPKSKKITIVDLGCGSGDMLCQIAKKFGPSGRTMELIGIDANAHIVALAQKWSKEFPNISYRKMLIPSSEFEALEYDIALSTLFLHHFKDNDLLKMLSIVQKKAKIGLVINDLQRNYLAYFLFYCISRFIRNRMVREDGLTSVSRGFKKSELLNFSKQLNLKSEIQWKWAFRYQWIIRS